MFIKRIARWTIMVVALLAITSPALAQCAMCKSAIASSENPEELARTINTAVLVLFIPVMIFFGAIFYLIFKSRHSPGIHESGSFQIRGADRCQQPQTSTDLQTVVSQSGNEKMLENLSMRIT
jgi:heme/copper-type cytochrome/quinol oxidase subunit 2